MTNVKRVGDLSEEERETVERTIQEMEAECSMYGIGVRQLDDGALILAKKGTIEQILSAMISTGQDECVIRISHASKKDRS